MSNGYAVSESHLLIYWTIRNNSFLIRLIQSLLRSYHNGVIPNYWALRTVGCGGELDRSASLFHSGAPSWRIHPSVLDG